MSARSFCRLLGRRSASIAAQIFPCVISPSEALSDRRAGTPARAGDTASEHGCSGSHKPDSVDSGGAAGSPVDADTGAGTTPWRTREAANTAYRHRRCAVLPAGPSR
jgi:hypothetical protein